MAAGYVVEYHIKHQTDPSLVRFADQFFYIFHRAVTWIDIVVIFHIVSIIVLR